MITRFLSYIVLVLVAVVAPWWAFVLSLPIFMSWFRFYAEAVLVALLLDTVFTATGGFGSIYVTIMAVVMLAVVEWVKSEVR